MRNGQRFNASLMNLCNGYKCGSQLLEENALKNKKETSLKLFNALTMENFVDVKIDRFHGSFFYLL
jgi:hypothetical protein